MSLDAGLHRNCSASLQRGPDRSRQNFPPRHWCRWWADCWSASLDGRRELSVPNSLSDRPTKTSPSSRSNTTNRNLLCSRATNGGQDCVGQAPSSAPMMHHPSRRRRTNSWNRRSNSEPKWWSNGRPSVRDRIGPLNGGNQSTGARWRRKPEKVPVSLRWPWPPTGIASCNGPPYNRCLLLHRSTWLKKNGPKFFCFSKKNRKEKETIWNTRRCWAQQEVGSTFSSSLVSPLPLGCPNSGK